VPQPLSSITDRAQEAFILHSDLIGAGLVMTTAFFAGSKRLIHIFPGFSRADLLALGAMGSAVCFGGRLFPKEPAWLKVALSSAVIYELFVIYGVIRGCINPKVSRRLSFQIGMVSGAKASFGGMAIVTLPTVISSTIRAAWRAKNEYYQDNPDEWDGLDPTERVNVAKKSFIADLPPLPWEDESPIANALASYRLSSMTINQCLWQLQPYFSDPSNEAPPRDLLEKNSHSLPKKQP